MVGALMDLPPNAPTANAGLQAKLLSKPVLLWAIPLAIFALDRLRWPTVASWREDEATVIWIGRHFAVTDFTVGIVSSTGLPNPNGLLWLAKLVSQAPDLYWSGVFMQLLHVAALFGVCLALARRVSTNAGLGLFVLTGALFAYRASCSEPFSQSLMLPTMLGCTCVFLLCVQTPSFALLFGLLALLWLPPALYIAGLLNSAIFVVALGACALRASFRERLLATDLKRPLSAFLVWSAAQLLLVWKPYFSVVSLHDLRAVSKVPFGERLLRAASELLRAPVWLWEHACLDGFRPSLYVDEHIVSSAWLGLLGDAAAWLFRGLMISAVVAAFRVRVWQRPELWRWIYWPLFLLLLALVFSPLLGGPSFSRGERPDIGLQFLCLVLIPIAVTLSAQPLEETAGVSALGLGLAFAAIEMLAGPIAVGAHLRYRGDVLSEADVPLRQKMRVIDTIVHEAQKRHLGPAIPIDYQVDGLWKWIRRFKPKALVHYGSPYTLGRAFDYDLERRYGIENALEGKRRGAPHWGFWVNYAFEPAPHGRGDTLREIGRLRVGFQPKKVDD
jgi:hypothetical protein